MPRIVIIGGSDAGTSAALRAREVDPGCEVTVVLADAFPSFSVCGIPFFISREVEDWRRLAHRSTAELAAAGLELMPETRAVALDIAGRRVTVSGRHGERALPFDRALVATGAVPVAPPIDGLRRPGVFFVRTMGDCLALDGFIEAHHPGRALILGGGYLGLEMADALARRGLEVAVLELGPTTMRSLDRPFAERLERELGRHGVTVRTGTRVTAIRSDGDGLAAIDADGGEHRGDLVLAVTGARPETALAEAAGLPLAQGGALAVDRRMRTPAPGILAAGDCARTWNALTADWSYQPLGTVAHKQGRVAGEILAGGDRVFAGALGTQVVKVFDRVAARTGLREDEARACGFTPVSHDSVADDHKAYYPQATPLTIRLVASRPDGRLLGAQMLGAYGAEIAKRIDVLATAIHHGATLPQIEDLDLSYTPPLGSPWDPVQSAAQALEARLRWD